MCACSVGCVTWCKKQGDAGVALVSRGRQRACVEALSVGSRVRKNSEIKAMAAKHGEACSGALPLCKGEEEHSVRARTRAMCSGAHEHKLELEPIRGGPTRDRADQRLR